ncbi:MAG: HAMP domain-containing sensor histidine kinase [Acidobacteriota bacterium]|nr:HAMP domain-containing sensor histidine kinase [Acidobacteriota bacterium]
MPDKLQEIAGIASDLGFAVIEIEDPDAIPHSTDECAAVLTLLVEEDDAGQLEAWGTHLKAAEVPFITITDDSEEMTLCAFSCGAFSNWPFNMTPASLMARLQNVALRLNYEQKLKQRIRDLEQMNQRMKRYVGNVAHDLRGPLGKLINTSEVLLSGVEADSLDTFYKIMARTSRRGFELVNNILDMTSLESGKLRIVQSRCNLSEIADQVITELNYLASDKEISLRNRILMPIDIVGDQQRLLQVLSNLVTNAVKFTPRFGTVTVQAKPGDGGMRVQVIDTGVGMSDAIVANLFELGEGKKSTLGTEGERGTGLGLAIAQEIIRAHGSEITVNSVPGEGSTFSFMLPVWQEQDT